MTVMSPLLTSVRSARSTPDGSSRAPAAFTPFVCSEYRENVPCSEYGGVGVGVAAGAGLGVAVAAGSGVGDG